MVHAQLKYDEFGRARATLMDFLNSYWFSTKKKPARALFAQHSQIEVDGVSRLIDLPSCWKMHFDHVPKKDRPAPSVRG